MKRPIGVVIAAVLLIVGSLLQLLGACVTAISAAIAPLHGHAGVAGSPAPAAQITTALPLIMYTTSAFLLALSAWGIVTAVGLFRLRRWARYSILIIAAGLAFISFFSILSSVLMSFVPLPQPPNLNAAQAHSAQLVGRLVFAVFAIFYAGLFSIAVWWLVYFNRRPVRELFAAGAPLDSAQSRRPLLISILAVLNLFGGAACLFAALLPLPTFLFGWTVHGTGKALMLIAMCALQVLVGIGLWRLQEWGRRLTFGVLGFGVLNSVVTLLRPSSLQHYYAELSQMVAPTPPHLPMRFQTAIYSGSMILGLIFCIAIAAILIHYRASFAVLASEPQSASS